MRTRLGGAGIGRRPRAEAARGAISRCWYWADGSEAAEDGACVVEQLQQERQLVRPGGYFGELVQNNSEIYNYHEWSTKNRASAAQHVKRDTREQSKTPTRARPAHHLLSPASGRSYRVLGSAAERDHAEHDGSRPLQHRLPYVHLDDIIAGRARNLDSRCTGTAMRDYLRASGLLHLSKDVVALYDDDSASGDRMLYFGDRLVSEG
jgi:hypothetical protein